jgi:hypothetical protein
MKPKMLIALVAVTFMVLLTSCKPKVSGQIVTNWVKPSENLRLVNGQLSNTADSKVWVHPSSVGVPAANPLDNPWNVINYSLRVETVGNDKITCGVYKNEYRHETYTGQLGLSDSTRTKNVVIFHYPNPQSLTTGQEISPLCLRVENYIQNGISLEAYDCGVQATSLVPVIREAVVNAGNAHILLVSASEADDFLKNKKIESENQCTRIKADIEKLQSELETNNSEYTEAKNVASQSYTNDSSFVELLTETQENIKTVETLAKAIKILRAKYGDPPDMLNQPFVRQYPQDQRAAWQAIREDTQRIQSIRRRANQIDIVDDSLPQKIQSKRNWRVKSAMAALDATKKKLDEANQNLKSAQSPAFYLTDFSPVALEMIQADKQGNFVIRNPKAGTKVFAKLKSEPTSEEFFWLLTLPQKGDKLILSENNLFTLNP